LADLKIDIHYYTHAKEVNVMVLFVTPCSLTLDYHTFGGKCFHHFQRQSEWCKYMLGFRKSYYCYNVRLYPEILCTLVPLAQTEISHGTLPWITH
jgi:hypothetical protein